MMKTHSFDEGFAALRDRTVTELYLISLRKIDVEGTKHLAEALENNTILTTLNLSSNLIDDEGAKNIAKVLKHNTTLTTLALGNNEIDVEGAKHIADALKQKTTLTTLDLGNNKIRTEGAKHIADALKQNTILETLNLKHNDIGDEEAKYIADALEQNRTLKTLDLKGNQIGHKEAKNIAEALKQNKTLTTLDLEGNKIGYDGARSIADALKHNTTLTTLDLRSNGIGVEGAPHVADALKHNKILTTLYLSYNKIRAQGAKNIAEALKQNKTLTKLDIEVNGIGYNGAKSIADALKHNTTLTTLDLRSNGIGAKGAAHVADALKHNKTLTTLYLNSNEIGAEGTKHIADALKQNTILTRLDLSGNKIDDEKAKHIADALKKNTALTDLNLRLNKIGDEGAKDIAEALKQNKTLKTLNLEYNLVGFEGETSLANALIEQWTNQRSLVLTYLRVDSKNQHQSLPADGRLARIPVNIRDCGLYAVHNYLLFLNQSSQLRRCIKLLVVGHERVGKTTLLDALQPLDGSADVRIRFLRGPILEEVHLFLNEYQLSIFANSVNDKPLHSFQLSKSWTLKKTRKDVENQWHILITPPSQQQPIDIGFYSRESWQEWSARLGRIIANESTEGIDVRRFFISPNQAGVGAAPSHVELVPTSTDAIEIAAWDFAGQESYYASHHHFISDQAIYIVVWNVCLGESLERLIFWLRSLKTRLAPYNPSINRTAIIVIGTHTDELQERDRSEQARRTRDFFVKEKAKEAGLLHPVEVFEVSCRSPDFTGIQQLHSFVSETATKLCGDGELVSSTCVLMDKVVSRLKDQHASFPIVRLKTVRKTIDDINTTGLQPTDIDLRQTLYQLDVWGRVVYSRTSGLDDLVILSPSFLTQETMGKLFQPGSIAIQNKGRFSSIFLDEIWKGEAYEPFRNELLTLMERFGVCFKQDDGMLVFPQLLDEAEPASLAHSWPSALPSNEIELVRIIDVDVLPPELVPSIMSRLHANVHNHIIWRRGALLSRWQTRALIKSRITDDVRERITIRVRAGRSESLIAFGLMEDIMQVVQMKLRAYPGIVAKESTECTECDPSMKCTVSLDECLQDMTQPKPSLLCGNYKPMSARELLQKAGELRQAPQGTDREKSVVKIDFSEIKLQQEIGGGGFGSVYRCTWTKVAGDCAAKQLNRMDERSRVLFRAEAAIMQQFHHPNLVLLYGLSEDAHGGLYLVMELMDKSLRNVLDDRSMRFQLVDVITMALDVTNAMQYLHSLEPPVLHRDLKSPNTLAEIVNGRVKTLKVADFGLAQRKPTGYSDDERTEKVGTRGWMAPEIVEGTHGASKQSDVYSFGVMLLELITRRSPTQTGLVYSPPLPSNTPLPLQAIIEDCTSKNMNERPEFSLIAKTLRDLQNDGSLPVEMISSFDTM